MCLQDSLTAEDFAFSEGLPGNKNNYTLTYRCCCGYVHICIILICHHCLRQGCPKKIWNRLSSISQHGTFWNCLASSTRKSYNNCHQQHYHIFHGQHTLGYSHHDCCLQWAGNKHHNREDRIRANSCGIPSKQWVSSFSSHLWSMISSKQWAKQSWIKFLWQD